MMLRSTFHTRAHWESQPRAALPKQVVPSCSAWSFVHPAEPGTVLNASQRHGMELACWVGRAVKSEKRVQCAQCYWSECGGQTDRVSAWEGVVSAGCLVE